MHVGYIHMIGGASGDMLLGALLDAGLTVEALQAELAKLPIPSCAIETKQDRRGGLQGLHVTLQTSTGEAESVRMGWDDFASTINAGSLSTTVAQRSLAVIRRLEEAERKVHRSGAEDPSPHPHELGTLDTLIDVVGTVAGFELLGIERLYASAIPMGSGVFNAAHGPLPAAAPATVELAAMAKAPVTTPPYGYTGELVTPTGAAIVTELCEFTRPAMRLERVGYGLGTRNPESYPNAVALWVGELDSVDVSSGVTLLETNMDDISPQILGYVQERLFALGALDVWHTSIQMKKNRPGVLLSVLVPESLEGQAVAMLFQETTTLGVRRRDVQRHVADREMRDVDTEYGRVPVKVKLLEGRVVAAAPEYDVCRGIAMQKGIPLQDVLALVAQAARQQLVGDAFQPLL
ncbi:MAG: nickel pincer cofactor biosynthesis protein LarC [SAR202 cluster bacterium]|nr:nickel pincer cofactor biosynthesis protein LarC [SAR202 cluster bacterium]